MTLIHYEQEEDSEDYDLNDGAVVSPKSVVSHVESRQEVEVHEIHAASDYDEDDDGPETGFFVGLHEPFENLPRLHPSVLQTPSNENY